MKRVLVAVLSVSAVVVLATVAFAQMGWGPMMGSGAGWGPMGAGAGWGHGMMGPGSAAAGPGWSGCPGMAWYGPGQAGPGQQATEEQAKEQAQQYADRYLKGFSVDKVLPFTGMSGMTMYSVELKNPQGELRIVHVNPWGNVMPFGGPWRRSG